MSLVNEMLKNLDRRQQRPAVVADLPPSRSHPQMPRMSTGGWVAAGVAAALLLGLAAFIVERLWLQDRQLDGAVPQTAVTVPVSEPDEAPAIVQSEVVQPEAVQTEAPTPEPVEETVEPAPAVVQQETVAESEPEPEPEPAIVQPPPAPAVSRTLRTTTPRERADEAYTTAVRHLAAGRRAQAESGFNEALGHDASHLEARSTLSSLLLGEGRVREAETLLQEGLRISPRHAPFADQYARILMQREDLAAALGVLERAAPAVENDPDYHALMGYLQQQAGHHEAAAGTYRALVAIRADQGNWWLGLGLSLEALQQPDRALDAYRRARSDPRLGNEVIRFVDERIRALGAP